MMPCRYTGNSRAATHPTRLPTLKARLADGSLHPRDAKMELAREIVGIFHGDDAAPDAEEHFRRTIQKSGLPEDVPVHFVSGPMSVV